MDLYTVNSSCLWKKDMMTYFEFYKPNYDEIMAGKDNENFNIEKQAEKKVWQNINLDLAHLSLENHLNI